MDLKSFSRFPFEKFLALAIIDKKYNILWTNELLESIFPKTLGKVCYKSVKGFKEPCDGCPLAHTLKDGTTHVALMPAPPKKSGEYLKYSQIVTIPLEFNKSKEVEKVIEIVFDISKELEYLYKDAINFTDFCDKLWNFAFKIDESMLYSLVLYGCVSEKGLNFDEAEILISTKTNDINLFNCHQLAKQMIVNDINRDFINAKKESDYFLVSELINSKVKITKKKISNKKEIDLINKLDANSHPVRIGSNQIALNMNKQANELEGLMFLRFSKENIFLKEIQILNLKHFFSIIKNAIKSKRDMEKRGIDLDSAIKNIEKYYKDARSVDKLSDVIPLAIGKIHDLGLIQERVKRAIKFLRDLEPYGKHFLSTRIDITKELHNSIISLDRLIKSMSSIAKLITPNIRKIDLKSIVEELKYSFSEDFVLNKITFNDSKIFSIVIGCDKELISQVLYNLVDNSIKALRYVDRIQKIIQIEFINKNDNILIKLSDNGSGIDPIYIDKIWAQCFSTRSGSGLGLYFSKHIVNRIHSGEISVRSKWGYETVFTISLPKEYKKERKS